MKTPISKLWCRIKVAWKILTQPKSRWVVIFVSEEGFRGLLTGDDIDVKMSYHRLQEYNMWHLIQSTGATKDNIDMMLMKAEFEAKAQEYADKKQNSRA